MQRFIIRKAIDFNCQFINHYITLNEKYNSPQEITESSIKFMQQEIIRKANLGRSKYLTYLDINPTLQRPDIYNTYIPTFKLHKVTQLRLVSHTLAIETGRNRRIPVPRENRLCSCGLIEDEQHFLLKCHHYSHIRNNYPQVNTTNDIYQILDNKFTANYISELWECRKLYIN